MQGTIEMKTKLLTATAILLLGLTANAGALSNNSGVGTRNSQDTSGKEDNLGYMRGPHWKYPMVRTSNRPFWHGMSSSRHSRHHWWEFWD
jgi:hypothetical protein